MTLRAISDSSVVVSWRKLDLRGLTNYIIIYSVKESESSESRTVALAIDGNLTIKGLTANREYQFQVQAQAIIDSEVIMGTRSQPVCITLQVLLPTLAGKGSN